MPDCAKGRWQAHDEPSNLPCQERLFHKLPSSQVFWLADVTSLLLAIAASRWCSATRRSVTARRAASSCLACQA